MLDQSPPLHALSAPASLTLGSDVAYSGVGLFTGAHATVTLLPLHPCAHPPTSQESHGGIFFRLTHGGQCVLVPATVEALIPERRRTVLGHVTNPTGSRSSTSSSQATQSNFVVQTVEHLLAALAGMGITDAVLSIDGPEIPIGDGSAAPFVSLIESVGTCPTSRSKPATPIKIVESFQVQDGDGIIQAFPSSQPGLDLTYELDYGPGAPIPRQSASMASRPGRGVADFASQIASARTFCLADEAVAMRKMGLFKSFEPKDLLVIGPNGPLDNAYRFPNEPARHKLLDLLGDLSLAGRPIQGRIVATRAGHALNHAMARALAMLP